LTADPNTTSVGVEQKLQTIPLARDELPPISSSLTRNRRASNTRDQKLSNLQCRGVFRNFGDVEVRSE